MARKRFIAPEFFTHEALYDAEEASGLPLRLAFSALWCHADRRGVFAWKPRVLKLTCLPYDPVDFGQVLDALESAGFVQGYEVDGRRYGIIPSFNRWQSFHKDERPSNAPMPPEPRETAAATPCQHGATTVLPHEEHGSSTPTAVTVTAAITASTATAAKRRRGDEVDAGFTARRLTAAANKGIAEQFGEQPVPIRWDHPGTAQTVADLDAAGVPVEEAERWLFDLARSRAPQDGKPPRTLKYYVAAVIDAWQAEQAHRDAATLPRPAGTGTVITWDDVYRANTTDPELRDVA